MNQQTSKKLVAYYSPFVLAVLATAFHAVFAKGIPQTADTWLSLTVTYAVSALLCLLMFFVTAEDKNIIRQYKQVTMSSVLLGVAVIGLEFGFIEMYKKGWPVSQAGLMVNAMSAILLAIVGFLLYKEKITIKQIFGIIICIIGMFLVTQ